MPSAIAAAQAKLARSGGIAALGLATALVGITAVRAPALAIGGTTALAFVVVCFRSLAWGTALFALLTFFNLFPGVGGASAPLVKLAGGVLLLAWLPSLARRGSLVPSLVVEQPFVSMAALSLAGWSFLSALWAVDTSLAFSNAARLLQGIVLVFIVAAAVRDRSAFRLVCFGYVAGAALTAIVGMAGGSAPEVVGPYADTTRLSGNIGDPNTFAAILLPALWMGAFALAEVRGALPRSLLVSACLVIAASIFYTQSRGGLIGLGVTFVVAPFLAGRARGRTIAAVLLIAAVGLFYYTIVAPPQAIQRVTHFTAEGGTGRTDAWKIALQLYGEHPLTGIGFGNFTILEPTHAAGNTSLQRPDLIVNTPIVVHNTYLHVLTELGPVGLALLLSFLLGAITVGTRAARRLNTAGYFGTEMLGRGVLIGACGMLASITFISGQSVKQLWLVFAIIVALTSVAQSVAPDVSPGRASRPLAEVPGRGRRE